LAIKGLLELGFDISNSARNQWIRLIPIKSIW